MDIVQESPIIASLDLKSLNAKMFVEELPDVRALDISSDESSVSVGSESDTELKSSCVPPKRGYLQWKFHGLTLWLELEEFDMDLTKAVQFFSNTFGTEAMPIPHLTAIYGMDHLSNEEAIAKMQIVKNNIPQWPRFGKPISVTQDIAINGRPGQVCTIAWAELKFASNPSHEEALDELYRIFYGSIDKREGPWNPHNSIAYDNPDGSPLNLMDTVSYVASKPTLLNSPRKVKAISLWDTNGRMGEWKCLHRIEFKDTST
jgi:hypothetical protein